MGDITLEKDWYNNELVCPVCKENNLHQNSVHVYNRVEDGSSVRATSVTGPEVHSTVLENNLTTNPSPRRQGLTVKFWCEHCHGDGSNYLTQFSLNILQHKGTTFLYWDIPKN